MYTNRRLGGAKLNDLILIKLVRQHPILYDVTHPKYLDRKMKEDVWSSLAKELNSDGPTCRLRWNNIRDQYRKRRKDIITKGGTSDNVKIYKYSKQLDFLVPFFKDKEITAPIDSKEEASLEVEDTLKVSSSPVDPLDIKRSQSAMSAQSDVSSSDSAESNNPLENLPSKVIESIIQYLLKKLESEMSPSDPIDVFLTMLAPTLKKLNPYKQHLAKGELFAVVYKYEMEMLTEEQSQTLNSTNE